MIKKPMRRLSAELGEMISQCSSARQHRHHKDARRRVLIDAKLFERIVACGAIRRLAARLADARSRAEDKAWPDTASRGSRTR